MSELAHSIYDWLYRDLSLRTAGLIVGLLLIASHAYALFNYQTLRSLLRDAPRNKTLGTAILAIALKPSDDDDEPVPLPPSHKRTKNKNAYLVSVQWQGYAEPSWVPLPSVLHTSIFQLWHPQRPLLRL